MRHPLGRGFLLLFIGLCLGLLTDVLFFGDDAGPIDRRTLWFAGIAVTLVGSALWTWGRSRAARRSDGDTGTASTVRRSTR
jgi:hypothetical protein